MQISWFDIFEEREFFKFQCKPNKCCLVFTMLFSISDYTKQKPQGSILLNLPSSTSCCWGEEQCNFLVFWIALARVLQISKPGG